MLTLEGALLRIIYGVDRERADNPLSITDVLAQDYEFQGMRIIQCSHFWKFYPKNAYVDPLPENAIALTWEICVDEPSLPKNRRINLAQSYNYVWWADEPFITEEPHCNVIDVMAWNNC